VEWTCCLDSNASTNGAVAVTGCDPINTPCCASIPSVLQAGVSLSGDVSGCSPLNFLLAWNGTDWFGNGVLLNCTGDADCGPMPVTVRFGCDPADATKYRCTFEFGGTVNQAIAFCPPNEIFNFGPFPVCGKGSVFASVSIGNPAQAPCCDPLPSQLTADVVFFGGATCDGQSICLIYDPIAGLWTWTGTFTGCTDGSPCSDFPTTITFAHDNLSGISTVTATVPGNGSVSAVMDAQCPPNISDIFTLGPFTFCGHNDVTMEVAVYSN